MSKKFIFLTIISLTALSCKKDKDSKVSATAPVVITVAVTNMTDNSATSGGTIVSDGGTTVTKSGIVWSKANNMPTLADSVVYSTTTVGAFTINLTGLSANTTYYTRAFATNSIGTGYGAVVTFKISVSGETVSFTYNGQEVTYGVIISPTTGKKWLDRNLGAKRAATAFDDYQAYGDLFQWGRPADGHQLMNWTASNAGVPVNGTTTNLATTDFPGHSNFITPTVSPGDWRTDNNSGRWASTPQGPCPTGWHVPILAEWKAEVFNDGSGSPITGTAPSGGMIKRSTAYDLLKLTVAAWREPNGSIFVGQDGGLTVGDLAEYWSSSDQVDRNLSVSYGWALNINPDDLQLNSLAKAYGASVRCINDN